jgi:hypothetical protein
MTRWRDAFRILPALVAVAAPFVPLIVALRVAPNHTTVNLIATIAAFLVLIFVAVVLPRISTKVWQWFIDRLLVAQKRYAFAVGCIAFEDTQTRPPRCLIVQRRFTNFGDARVWLWPGGRFRGGDTEGENFEDEIKRLVQEETGCRITLLTPLRDTRSEGFSQNVETYNPVTGRIDIRNELYAPPMVIMQQNRKQRRGVPGHIDLIFVGRVRAGEKPTGDAFWLDVEQMEDEDERRLWPDTKECIRRAHAIYSQISQSSQPASLPPDDGLARPSLPRPGRLLLFAWAGLAAHRHRRV